MIRLSSILVLAIAILALSTGRTLHIRYARALANPNELTLEERQAGLDRPIAPIEFKSTKLGEALTQIEQAAGVRVELERMSLGTRNLNLDEPVSLVLRDMSVADALDELLGPVPLIAYGVRGGKIVVSLETDLPQLLRVYDVHDLTEFHSPPTLISPFVRQRNGSPVNELRDHISWDVDLCYWHSDDAGWRSNRNSADFDCWSGSLMIVQPLQRHRQVSRLLDAIRNARPDGSGLVRAPQLSWMGARVVHGSAMRVYDVRDLLKNYEPPANEEDWGTKRALQLMFGDSSKDPVFRHPADIIAGRLLFYASPADHQKIAELLRQRRGGHSPPYGR